MNVFLNDSVIKCKICCFWFHLTFHDIFNVSTIKLNPSVNFRMKFIKIKWLYFEFQISSMKMAFIFLKISLSLTLGRNGLYKKTDWSDMFLMGHFYYPVVGLSFIIDSNLGWSDVHDFWVAYIFKLTLTHNRKKKPFVLILMLQELW